MSALLAMLLTACDPATVASLPELKRDLGCELAAADPRAVTIDRARLDEIYARPELSRARLRDETGIEVLLARLNAWFDRFFTTRGMESYSAVYRWLVLVLGALIA